MQGDRILRINEIEVDAPKAQAVIAAAAPGSKLLFYLMRGTTPMQLEVTADERERWSTPSAYRAAVTFAATGISETSRSSDPVLERALAAAPEMLAVNQRLDRMFAELARDDSGYHKLPLVRSAFLRPGEMSNWRDRLVDAMGTSTQDRRAAIRVICDTLALTCPARTEAAPEGPISLAQFAAVISDANDRVREVFHAAQVDRGQAATDMRYLMEKAAADRTLLDQPDVARGIRAMQLSMRVDLSALLAILDRMLANAQQLPALDAPPRKPPAALAAIVQGEIVDYVEVDSGYVVIGGAGPNGYAMDRIHAVIDIGGNDTYRWGIGAARETQTVIDFAGDDRYEASYGGPAAGWLGVSLLIDRAGNDTYQSRLGGCGSGALGFGLLFDDAGVDNYHCAAWSLGAGLYGGGVVIDGGAETDVYLSEVFSQGVGGPRGAGLLVDAGGADLYRASGPVPSSYDVAGSYMSFSQGVGVGIRPYDFGGVGMLLDLGGDDRFEGGEFSQGGGYFWGVGLLYDAAGNDMYYGNRYAQGFAAHQAFGMLADIAGDDIYWSMTAAGQAAAWDQSVAMLFDGGGNDVYRAQHLSQGAAAQQARASLHDVSGDDVYWAGSDVAQGAAGDNSYHFDSGDPIYSFGVLLDERGADRYSTALQDSEMRLRPIAGDAKQGRGIAGVANDLE
jgi:hypothetical protein